MASGIDRLRRLPTTEGPCERWRRLLSDASVAGLHAFVYWFSLPARLFGRIAETPILALSDWRLLAAYHPGGLLESALAMVVGQVAATTAHPCSACVSVDHIDPFSVMTRLARGPSPRDLSCRLAGPIRS